MTSLINSITTELKNFATFAMGVGCTCANVALVFHISRHFLYDTYAPGERDLSPSLQAKPVIKEDVTATPHESIRLHHLFRAVLDPFRPAMDKLRYGDTFYAAAGLFANFARVAAWRLEGTIYERAAKGAAELTQMSGMVIARTIAWTGYSRILSSFMSSGKPLLSKSIPLDALYRIFVGNLVGLLSSPTTPPLDQMRDQVQRMDVPSS